MMIELPQRCFVGRVNPRWFARVRPLYLNYTGSETLTDFQVKCTLTSSDIPFEKLRDDKRDLLFVDRNNEIIPYWIEKADNTEIIVWLKFPEIIPGKEIFWLYYGNSGFAGRESDAQEIFNFFDDFDEDTSSQYAIIKYASTSGSFTIEPGNSWAKTDTSSAHMAWRSSESFSQRGYIVETVAKTGDDDVVGIGWLQSDGKGYAGYVREDPNYDGGIDKKNSTSEKFDYPEATLSEAPPSVTHHWYYIKLSLTEDSVLLYVKDQENNFEANATLSDTSYIGGAPALISGANNPEAYYKYLRVRQYAVVEPVIET